MGDLSSLPIREDKAAWKYLGTLRHHFIGLDGLMTLDGCVGRISEEVGEMGDTWKDIKSGGR